MRKPSPSTRKTKSKPRKSAKATPKSGRALVKATSPSSKSTTSPKPRAPRRKFAYDVCLSFAGENRPRVEKVRNRLAAKGISVFYDYDFPAELWGKNLYEHLADIYANKARFCVIFVSKHYVRKSWPNHERQSAQSRAFLSGDDYILYVLMDDTSLPGLLPTTGIIRLSEHGVVGVSKLIEKKVLASRSVKNRLATPQVPLKPKKSSPRKKTLSKPEMFSCASRISSSADWILLGEWFYKAQVKSHGGKFEITIVADDEQEARLNTLSPGYSIYNNTQRMAFAYRNSAFWCQVEDVVSHTKGRKIVFTLTLSHQSGYQQGFSSAVWNHQNVQERVAESLLKSHPNASIDGGQFLRSRSQASKIFSAFWMQMQGQNLTPVDVLRCARLKAIFHLISTGLAQQVNELTLGPTARGSFKVKFRGTYNTPYSGQKPQAVEVTGEASFKDET